MSPRQSNSKKTPNKNGVTGANKNDAHEVKDEKQKALETRREKQKRQKNLILLKKKKKKNASNSNLPEGLRTHGFIED